MASTIKQRLRRYNGTDYDTVHLETDSDNVMVEEYIPTSNPLNTDQLTLGQNDVYFKEYPDIKWCVDHLDGDYAYLGLYNASEKTKFGSSTTYIGSTIAAKCTDFLNNTIPNVSSYLENVTVEGVTAKVFIPTYYQFSGQTGYGDTTGPIFAYPSTSADNRKACVSKWNVIGSTFWLSSPCSSFNVLFLRYDGDFNDGDHASSRGFRPEVKVRYKGYEPVKVETPLTEVLASLDDGEKIADIDGDVLPGDIVDWAGHTWLVMHRTKDYAYLIHNDIIENTTWGVSAYAGYPGSTVHDRCLTFQDTIDSQYLQCCQNVMGSYVFLPSYDQLNSYFPYMKTAANRIAKLNGAVTTWWLSSPNSSVTIWGVLADGSFGTDFYPTYSIGFRPAVKVRVKSIPYPDNPLNTDQLTLGQHDVYFTAYPSLKWCVDHLDGDYVYLGLYNASETTVFRSSGTSYSGSTIYSKCATFLSGTIPNVSKYLETVTVNGVANNIVFIPSYKMFSGVASSNGVDASDPTFSWPSASAANRVDCVSNWSTIGNCFWLSSPYSSSYVWRVNINGNFNYIGPANSIGFRPEVKLRYKW